MGQDNGVRGRGWRMHEKQTAFDLRTGILEKKTLTSFMLIKGIGRKRLCVEASKLILLIY